MIIAQNVFGIEASTRMMFCKIDPRDYGALKTFLSYTSAMPSIVTGINGKDIIAKDISADTRIVEILGKI